MACDEGLAQRVREVCEVHPACTEKRMLGGICVLMNGNMACGVLEDYIIVRLEPATYEADLAKPGVAPFEFTGRPMKGWVIVHDEALDSDDVLAGWLERGMAYALSLPPK